MQHILGITAVISEELPDDIQHTKERKPDVLKKITDNKENTFVLQIEFQVVDEPKMLYRMAEYYVMLARKYEMPIRQYVIFIGASSPKMVAKYESQYFRFEFPIINFLEIDYQIFIRSDKPEDIILSVLANFKQENSEIVLKKIINRIEETTDGDFLLKRYFRQLRILAQLRKLEGKLKSIVMENITKYIDEKKDVAYLIGMDKGEERAKEKEQTRFVTNLLVDSDFTIDKIAKISGVSIAFVEQIKQKIKF